ncbi:MAG: hypothetical protein IKQ39_04735 [Oscillospiraceae bacterium]|nr:hypothetical protein [Oscillospiraceae bacterium]
MNHHPILNLVLRYFIILLSVIGTAGLFLFLPSPAVQKQKSGYSYYSSLTGTATCTQPESTDSLQELPELSHRKMQYTVQAEYMELPEEASVSKRRSGYQGNGYVAGLPAHTEKALVFPVHIPYSQHYAVTVCAASAKTVENAIRINGELLSDFTLIGDSRFTLVTFYGIFMEEGSAEIAIDTGEPGIEVDFIRLREDFSLDNQVFRIADSPCNPNAAPETVTLYQTLAAEWDSSMITGQYVSDNSNRELNMIYQVTGQLPAIRFSALGTRDDREVISGAMDWHVYMHGIVGLMWHWQAPGSDSVYAEEADFDLYEALRDADPEKLAAMTPEEADKAVSDGTLTPDARSLLADIDETSAMLIRLRNMDIPVLWRPLHEAGGGWYWWGAYGRDSYEKLWLLLYYRMTDYHNLNNLIWVWNGQSASYLVPERTYDIAAADIYLSPEMEFGSRHEQFQALANLTHHRKMLALSECSSLPNPDQMLLDRSVWSFFGLWYGEYLMNPDGTLSESYYSSSDLYKLYNSKQVLSLNDFLSIYQ